MATKQVTMELAKVTKGTFVYKTMAGNKEPVVDSVYVNKEAAPKTPPPTITLTVEWKE